MSIAIERIDHVVLTVRDIDTTIAFYCDLLGMSLETFGDNRKALVFGRQKFNLHSIDSGIEPKAADPCPGAIDICLITSSSMEEVVQTLIKSAVPIEAGPAARTGALGALTSVYFRDPDNNLIEVSRYDTHHLNEDNPKAAKPTVGAAIALPEYAVFDAVELPDPRTSRYSDMILALVDIVELEGPATVRTVLDRYRVGAGLGKLRGPTREAITSALSYALTSKRIVKLFADPEDPSSDVVALPGTPPVRLRERGPRDLEDIPLDEIAELAQRIEIQADEDDDSAFRRMLEAYGLKRLTETAKLRLAKALGRDLSSGSN